MDKKLETIKQGFDGYVAKVYPNGIGADQYREVLLSFHAGTSWMLGKVLDVAELDESAAIEALATVKAELTALLKKVAR